MGAQIHSVPAVVSPEPCEVAVRPAPGRLKPYVLGFSGFRSGSGSPVEHLVLPLASATVIVDFGSPSGIVSGPRSTATTRGDTRWGHGVSVGLTPLGVRALLGVSMGELAGGTVALTDLLGPAATELPGLLGAAASWGDRFDRLEASISTVRDRSAAVDPAVTAAWWRLQQPGPPPIGPLAEELGVTRRTLERGFRQHVGMSPATVARIARFQRVAGRLGSGVAPSDAAADTGFADHPHLARETRSMAGLTPTGLAAHLATRPQVVSQSSKTGAATRA